LHDRNAHRDRRWRVHIFTHRADDMVRDRLREQLLISNLNNSILGGSGRVTRWRSPIAVSTNGIARAESALVHFEDWTGGLVRFTRVNQSPANGLTFIEGGAGGPESIESCGAIGDAQPVAGQPTTVFQLA
jgi:hypothetical protein